MGVLSIFDSLISPGVKRNLVGFYDENSLLPRRSRNRGDGTGDRLLGSRVWVIHVVATPF